MKPLIPMLAITGKPQIEDITQMFQAYQKVGIDAVMLYPRSGLEIEYMSEDWRQFCYEVICVAKEIGMKIWLYDEFNWPSGSCKNAVAKENPAYVAKRFVYNEGTVCVDVMKTGDAERVFDPFDSDMLNPDAIQCFIRLTHEKYYKWFGEYFGNVIPGIFTDEPSFIYTSNSDGMYPYYEGVEEDYLKTCGRNLRKDIIAFEEGKESPCFPGVFRRLISKKFKECYIVPIAKWCQEHNLLLTGHTLEDARPLLGTEVTGNWFEFMDEFDVPGIDEILTKFWDRHDMLFGMIENLRYNGKKAAMAELFALGPCSMSFARRRQMLWYAAAHGINHYFIAISHLDGKGNVLKPDFFDNFNNYNFDFKGVRLLADEAYKAALFSGKRVRASVGVRCAYTAYLDALCKRTDEEVAERFSSLVHTLTMHQISWRMLREEEDNECKFVLNLDGTTIVEERTGKRFHEIEELISWIDEDDEGPYVTSRTGEPTHNLLVKSYEDGTVIVIDYENEPKGRRDYTLHTMSGDKDFSLESYGVMVFENDVWADASGTSEGQEEIVPEISVVHKHSNIYRCVFLQEPTVELQITESMTVRVYRREYQREEKSVTLDGRKLEFHGSSEELTGCFSELYKGTEVYLTEGKHQIQTDMKDYPYLPAVLICGDFTINENNLMPPNDSGQTFFGEIQVVAKMTLPKDAKDFKICMDDCQLYVTATIEGESIGTCAFAPYSFQVPSKYFGREVEVTFTFYSTLAPMFGDLRDMQDKGVFVFAPCWEEMPASSPEVLDIKKLRVRGVKL